MARVKARKTQGGDFATAWRPADESTDTLAGTFESRSFRDPDGKKVTKGYPIFTLVVAPLNEYGELVDPTDPEAIVSTEDGQPIPFGERRAVHAGRKALVDFLDEQDPQEGDTVILTKYPKVLKENTKSGRDFVPYDTSSWDADGEPNFEVEDEAEEAYA
jgi:hypothetical protein